MVGLIQERKEQVAVADSWFVSLSCLLKGLLGVCHCLPGSGCPGSCWCLGHEKSRCVPVGGIFYMKFSISFLYQCVAIVYSKVNKFPEVNYNISYGSTLLLRNWHS